LCKAEAEWVSQLMLLMKNKRLCKQMKQNNAKKVKQIFQWQVAAEKHLLLFEKLMR